MINMHPNKAGNLAQWRNWTTPTLTAGNPSETTTPAQTTSSAETTSPPPTGTGCSATVEVVSRWDSGRQGNVLVTAGAGAIGGWTLNWTWPGGQRITSSWNAEVTTSGSGVTAFDRIAAGRTASAWGFVAGGTSTAPAVTCTPA